MDDYAIDLLLILSLLTADDVLHDLNYETDFDDYDDATMMIVMMMMDLVDY
jgi:hypothetical protein